MRRLVLDVLLPWGSERFLPSLRLNNFNVSLPKRAVPFLAEYGFSSLIPACSVGCFLRWRSLLARHELERADEAVPLLDPGLKEMVAFKDGVQIGKYGVGCKRALMMPG